MIERENSTCRRNGTSSVRWVWRLLKLALALVGLSVAFAAIVLIRGGLLRSVEPISPGECARIALPGSAEDIVVDHAAGFAYLSVLDRRALVEGKPPAGDLLRLDLHDLSSPPVSALVDTPNAFRPHGLSLWQSEGEPTRLFVISHPSSENEGEEQVLIYAEILPGSFELRRAIKDPALVSPNDLAAVGANEFYVANDGGAGVLGSLGQLLFGIGGSPLTYFDGEKGRVLPTKVASGGGISLDPDGQSIWVAETLGSRVRRFTIDGPGRLTEADRVKLPAGADNLDVDDSGALWVAGHANTLDLVRHFMAAEHPAPSSVYRLSREGRRFQAVYVDTGQAFSAASVGARANGRLLVGSITEKSVLICQISD